ncbi:MAG: NADH-quinone oxidoreductase subunit M, partial [Rickettsiales bacterium]
DETSLKNAKNVSLLTTIVTFIWATIIAFNFEKGTADFQFVEKYQWVAGYDINYYLGIDGIALTMILLTTLLMPLCILASWHIKERAKEYMICFLLMQGLVIGVFCALDMVLFYLFFEAVLIPMFLIIGVWGGQNRVYAAFKFFLYTLAGSVLLLIAIIYMYIDTGTTSVPALMEAAPNFSINVQCWLWVALFASFAVKVPMWPFHTWLPDAHVQAPTAGSVILAGVLLKMGAYGFLRFSLPMLPAASYIFADFVIMLSLVAIVYTSLVALVQEDMKKLIAYSSVAHMGFVTLGIFSFTQQGLDGAIFQMISHGLVSGALFLCVGVIYERMHTREIAKFGGLVQRMPKYAFVFMVFTMASIGLPTTSGFVGEFLTFMGVYQKSPIAATIATTGVIFGAIYMLWLYRKVMFGELNSGCRNIKDLNDREYIPLMLLVALVIILGLQPNVVLDVIKAPVEQILIQIGNSR